MFKATSDVTSDCFTYQFQQLFIFACHRVVSFDFATKIISKNIM